MDNPFELIDRRLAAIEKLLTEIHAEIRKPTVEADRWLTISEFREYHPDKPQKATVYAWVNQQTVPVHKSAKRLRFLKSEIDNWLLASGKQKTVKELAEMADAYIKTKGRGVQNPTF